MGNTTGTFESEVMSTVRRRDSGIDRRSKTPEHFSTGGGVVTPDEDGGGPASRHPPPQSVEAAASSNGGLSRHQNEFLTNLENALDVSPLTLGNKRTRLVSASESQAETCVECEHGDNRTTAAAKASTGVLDAALEYAAMASTGAVASAVPEIVQDETVGSD